VIRVNSCHTGARGGFISFDANGDTEDSYIAVGSLDLFSSKTNSSADVQRNVMIPFGYFRGTVSYSKIVYIIIEVHNNFAFKVFVPSPTVEFNQTIHNRLSENNYAKVTYDAELLNDNINILMVVVHLLTLVAMAYTFTYQTRKLAAKMDILTIKVAVSSDAELCAHLLDAKQVKIKFQYPSEY
jgi:hypothetical protein